LGKRSGKVWAPLVATALASLATGCGLFGPGTVDIGRPRYNEAVQQTNQEQLLLNLVRLRFRDAPLFLQVASISTSFEFEAQANAVGTLMRGPNAASLLFGGRALEAPTITYAPLSGEQFVKQMMSPIGLDTLLLLYHSGWSIERVLRICVQRMNEVPNAPSASGPTPDLEPEFRRFQEATRHLRALQRRGLLELRGADQGLELELRRGGGDSSDWRAFADLLSLDPKRTRFRLGVGRSVRLVTRSVMAALFYLSHGVEVPEEDLEAGRVTHTATAAGEPFDWRELTGDLLQVHSGRRPRDHAVRARYRGTWFYIDDSDLSSKSTFSLLTQLIQLQAGDVGRTGPLLTLPVAR
jgi:hypothetical protein